MKFREMPKIGDIYSWNARGVMRPGVILRFSGVIEILDVTRKNTKVKILSSNSKFWPIGATEVFCNPLFQKDVFLRKL